MSSRLAHAIVIALEIYLGLGLVFALVFLARGVARIDPAAARAGWGFRLLILPGTVALWPLLLGRWRRAARGEPLVPEEANAHRDAARGRA